MEPGQGIVHIWTISNVAQSRMWFTSAALHCWQSRCLSRVGSRTQDSYSPALTLTVLPELSENIRANQCNQTSESQRSWQVKMSCLLYLLVHLDGVQSRKPQDCSSCFKIAEGWMRLTLKSKAKEELSDATYKGSGLIVAPCNHLIIMNVFSLPASHLLYAISLSYFITCR